MNTAAGAPNPINRRGIAKPDVYRILRRLDENGLHELEREELERRRRESGLRLPALPTGNKRPSGQLIAQALLLEADMREWMGEGPDELQQRILDAREAGHITGEQSDALLKHAWKDQVDRCRWAGVLLAILATTRGLSAAEAELLRKLDAGEEPELPDDLEREADKHLERERKRHRSFARQLGKLREQPPLEQGRTIADWRRNDRRAPSKGTARVLPF